MISVRGFQEARDRNPGFIDLPRDRKAGALPRRHSASHVDGMFEAGITQD
jgi:hypothetical protein